MGKEKLTGLVKLGQRSQKSLQGFKLRKIVVPLTKRVDDLGRGEHQCTHFQIYVGIQNLRLQILKPRYKCPANHLERTGLYIALMSGVHQRNKAGNMS